MQCSAMQCTTPSDAPNQQSNVTSTMLRCIAAAATAADASRLHRNCVHQRYHSPSAAGAAAGAGCIYTIASRPANHAARPCHAMPRTSLAAAAAAAAAGGEGGGGGRRGGGGGGGGEGRVVVQCSVSRHDDQTHIYMSVCSRS